MLLKRISALAAVAALAGGIVAQGASAASIGGFSARPAQFNPRIPATRSYFIQTVRRGDSFVGRVIVVNTASGAVTLRVYAVDGLTGVTSGAVYGNRRDRLHGAGKWVRPAVSKVLVRPHSQLSLSFKVRIPRNASPGDHLAGLALEDAHRRTSRGRFAITEIIRTVVAIELHVRGRAQQHIQLRRLSIRALPGTSYPSLVVALADTGRLLCKPRLSVRLTGRGAAQQVARRLDTILPGDAIAYPFAWPRSLAPGTYDATVAASGCGQRAVLRSRATLGRRLRAGVDSSAPAPRSDTSGGVGWWPMILVALGGVSLGAVLARGRRSISRSR